MRRAAGLLAALALAAAGCVQTEPPSPFRGQDAGTGSDAPDDAPPGTAGDADAADALDAPDADPELGGPCADDGQCDDDVACTRDGCDLAVRRCRHVPDDAPCQNAIYCDGEERCDPKLGCRSGPPITCSDGDGCTFDRCVERTRGCEHAPRDADGDGDPDVHCKGGGDCDDANPAVSSAAAEVCANQVDDDCDGQVDETPCDAGQHDACGDALALPGPGVFALDFAGARLDYAATCAPAGGAGADVVATVTIPAGAPADLDVVVEAASGDVAVAIEATCGDAGSELACSPGYAAPRGGRVARARGRSLAPGTYAVVVYGTFAAGVTLHVDMRDPSAQPANETCGTAAPVTPGTPAIASLVGTALDVASTCASSVGDLVFAFDLAAPADVRVTATSLDGWGEPALSLRGAGCALPDDEIACQSDASPAVFARGLPAGSYAVRVSASAPTDASVLVSVAPPTPAPPDETCDAAPAIAANTTTSLTLADHVDDVRLGCAIGMVDAARTLELPRASDVLLLERLSSGDVAAIELAAPACAAPTDLRACAIGGSSPVRAAARNVPAGSWRVVAESRLAAPVEVTALVRDTVPATLVPFADVCASAVDVPAGGGFFQGNTANASADYPAGCDGGGVSGAGGPDQVLRLVLAKKQRVVADMQGSSYTTLLDVRRGPACPGTEVPNGCSVGFSSSRSFVDLVLDPGTYWLQVDGYGGNAGAWQMDVRVVDP